MTEEDRVREEIAKELHETHKKNCKRMFSWDMQDTPWKELSPWTKHHYRNAAQQVIKTKGLHIEADDQSLDKFLKIVGKRYPEFLGLIIKDNWVRCLPTKGGEVRCLGGDG